MYPTYDTVTQLQQEVASVQFWCRVGRDGARAERDEPKDFTRDFSLERFKQNHCRKPVNQDKNRTAFHLAISNCFVCDDREKKRKKN